MEFLPSISAWCELRILSKQENDLDSADRIGPSWWQSGSYQNWVGTSTGNEPKGRVIAQNDFTWIKNKHNLRFGVEHRRYYINSAFQNTPGSWTFNADQTALSNFQGNTGFGFASFILGAARNTGVGIVGMTQGVRSRTTGLYVHYDWKVNEKLTVNFGLRWDIPTGYTNPNNMMSALDPNLPNPGADGYKGTRLNDTYVGNINQLDPKYLSLGDALIEDIADHPEIKKPYPSFEGTVAQALLPYPQYTGVSTHRDNAGWSNYHSLPVTATRRVSNGLNFLVAYTFSKSLATCDNAMGSKYYGSYGQSIYNRKLDYSVTTLNVPNDLRITWIYDLPFGPQGHWLRSGPMSYVLGGWTVSGINHFRSGSPISIGNSGGPDTNALFNNSFYVDTLMSRGLQVTGSKPSDPDRGNGTPYLNPAAWGAVPVTDNNVPLRLRNGSNTQPNLRGFAQSSEQISLIKRTRLRFREATNFELCADISNPLNRTWIADPETDIGDSARFGRIFNKFGGGRTIQLGLRINF